MVTLLALTSIILLPPEQSEPPPAPPQLGFELAGFINVSDSPAPVNVTSLFTIIFSIYVPASA